MDRVFDRGETDTPDLPRTALATSDWGLMNEGLPFLSANLF